MRHSHVLLLVLGTLASCLLTTPCTAAIITTSGNFTWLSAPVDVRVGNTESNTNAFIFQEQFRYQLGPAGVTVNVSAPGTANNSNNYQPSLATVGANKLVDVFFVHMDTADNHSHTFGVNTLTFAYPVLGVILKTSEFTTSKFLQLPLPSRYPNAGGSPFEGNRNAVLTLDPTRHIITFNTQVSAAADDIRILMEVPEPASMTLMLSGLGIAAVVGYRRRVSR